MVNINNIKYNDDIRGDRLKAIFKKQKKLMDKYHQIEKDNGLLQTEEVPVDLHSKFGQARLKDFAWRITEELGEALEAFRIHKDPKHCNEEIADALHFLTEMTILADVSPAQIVNYEDANDYDKMVAIYREVFNYRKWRHDNTSNLYLSPTFTSPELTDDDIKETRVLRILTYGVGRVIEALGVACNFLKNKPWKQSEMITDVGRFKKQMIIVWHRFIELCILADIYDRELTYLYFGKSEVNDWRIETDY